MAVNSLPRETAAVPGAGPAHRLRSLVAPTLTLALFLAAAWAIHRELAAWTFADIAEALGGMAGGRVALAILAAALSYAVLSLYDPLALRHQGNALPLRRGALASFVGYAFSHTMGMPLFTGGAVRYRLYSAWGLPAGEIAGIIAFNSLTLWLGVAAMLALGGLAAPAAIGGLLHLAPVAVAGLSTGLCVLLLAYPCLGLVFRRPLRLRDWSFAWPSPPLALAQLLLAAIDWSLAALTLWLLLPPVGLGFFAFAGVYTAASIAGVVSHVPAGLGVFEAVLLLALPEAAHAPGVAAALILYRLIYYVLPLLLAALVFAAHQATAAGGVLLERVDLVRRGAQLVLPNLLGTLVFIGGAILLISGATPTVPARLEWLGPLAPLVVIELSHFFGSLAGMALLVLALGLRRRLHAAYVATVAVLAAGILFSLLKGLDWEEALYLAVVLAALLPSRGAFYRKSRLQAQRYSVSSLVAILAVLLGTTWLGFFCYRHVDYANELWWQFVLEGDAPRFLRATIGVVVAMVLLGGLQLVRFAQPKPLVPASEPDGIERAVAALATAEAPAAGAWLAALGDKRFLFSESGRSFVMYAVQGRSWIVMGEPVGVAAERLELLWRFRERCDAWGGRAVFYEIGPGVMPDLVELGLTFYKLGEQAYVPLAGFDLAGSARSGLRQAQRRAQRDGATFEVVPAEGVEPLLPELKAISDAWLGEQDRQGEELLARPLRSGLPAAVPGGAGAQGAADRGVRQPLGHARPPRAVDRPDALPRPAGPRRHGLSVHRADAVGPAGGLWPLRPRHGAAVGHAGAPAGAALDPRRRPAVLARREILQFRGPAPLQGEVQAGVGAALPRCPRRSRRRGRARRRDRAGQR